MAYRKCLTSCGNFSPALCNRVLLIQSMNTAMQKLFYHYCSCLWWSSFTTAFQLPWFSPTFRIPLTVTMKLSAALKDILEGVTNAKYFTSTTIADYDARGYFRGLESKQEAHSIWSKTIIPRMIASKHPGLHQTGMKLLKQWKTKAYRKEVEEFWWEQETIRPSQLVVTQSVQLHQARILQHSYKNLCHTLDKREGMDVRCFIRPLYTLKGLI